MQRRELLRFAGVSLAAVLIDYPLALAAARESAEPLVLNRDEWYGLEAVCARILPPVNGVSVADAGCVNFIDKLLAHEERALAPGYRMALGALTRQGGGQQAFASIAANRQDELLAMLEDGVLESWPADGLAQPEFFGLLRWHTLLGFLADPRYGGNRNGVGWHAIGHAGHLHAHGGVSDEQLAGLAEGAVGNLPER